MPDFNFTVDDIVSLSHECLHAAIRTMYHVGIRIQRNNHEALNRYNDYLFEKLMIKLHKLEGKDG